MGWSFGNDKGKAIFFFEVRVYLGLRVFSTKLLYWLICPEESADLRQTNHVAERFVEYWQHVTVHVMEYSETENPFWEGEDTGILISKAVTLILTVNVIWKQF